MREILFKLQVRLSVLHFPRQCQTKPDHTHIVDAINEGIIAAVAHRQPIAAEPHDAYKVIIIDFRYSHVQYIVEL